MISLSLSFVSFSLTNDMSHGMLVVVRVPLTSVPPQGFFLSARRYHHADHRPRPASEDPESLRMSPES